MKKLSKKLLSLVFVCLLVFSTGAIAFAADEPACPLQVTINNNRNSYSTYGVAKFDVKVTNISEAAVENISVENLGDQLAPLGSKSVIKVEKDSLAPGASIEFSFKATLNKNTVALRGIQKSTLAFVRMWYKNINVVDNGFDDGRTNFDTIKTVKFGKFEVTDTVRVWYNSGIKLFINQNDYETTENDVSITGSVEAEAGLRDVTYSVVSYSDNGEPSATGKAIIDGINWKIGLLLKPDFNKVTVFAEDMLGRIVSKTITITYDNGEAYQFNVNNVKTDNTTKISYINNIIIVFFNEGVTEGRKQEIVESIGGTVVGAFNGINQLQIQVEEKSFDELKLLANQLMQLDDVKYATYDKASKINTSAVAPNDTWKSDVNSADWTDNDVDGSNWWSEAVEAPKAWDYNNRLSKIKIGIVDNGFDTGHEDLSINFPSQIEANVNSKEDHGSHVAGIIGAKPNNNKGITGIVWNSKLMCVDWQPTWFQSLLGGWDTQTAIYAGLIETVEAGAKVVNFSIGSSGSLSTNNDSYTQASIDNEGKTASLYMNSLLLDHDFIVVQSAGNGARDQIGVDAKNNGMFASITENNCYEPFGGFSKSDILNRVIIVAAAEQNGTGYRVTNFSNGGTQVDIAAPGRDVYSTITGGFAGGYSIMSGTSMAAPVVTGVASLVWSVNNNFTGAQVRDIVCNNTNKTVTDNTSSPNATGSFPMVNAKLAVEKAIELTDAAGTLSGRFVNATNGNIISSNVSVTLDSYTGYGTPPSSFTVTGGIFSRQLPAGEYRFKLSADGYIEKYITATIVANSTKNLGDIPLSTGLLSNQIRVVLRWNETPRDIDSHFIGKNLSDELYHVAYYDRGSYDLAWLDRDDVDSYGPETVTIDLTKFKEFNYCVHNYSNRRAESSDQAAIYMAQSGATVEVYSGDDLISYYNIPDNRKGTVWEVFSMTSSGVISEINTFKYESNPQNVGMPESFRTAQSNAIMNISSQ